MDTSIRLDSLTWPQVAAVRDKCDGILLLPIGATEQHGPHLPINTDTCIVENICRYASKRTGIPILPALSFTVSSGHTPKWPGTFSLTHETFIATVREITAWAVATGWSRILLVNSHFGNDASLRVAVEKLRLEFLGKLQVGLRHTFLLTDSIRDYFVSDAEDLHANRAETDLLLHLAPNTVTMDTVEDDPDRTEGTVFSYPVAQTSLNGITGSPSLGDANRGKELFEEMGEALAEILNRARTESAPLPSSQWEHLPGIPLPAP